MYKWCEGETLKRRVPELEEIRVHVNCWKWMLDRPHRQARPCQWGRAIFPDCYMARLGACSQGLDSHVQVSVSPRTPRVHYVCVRASQRGHPVGQTG